MLDYDLEQYIGRVRTVYKGQRDLMIEMMTTYFPPEIQFTKPEGGMFLWVTLPARISALALFEIALREKVAFVPRAAFFHRWDGRSYLTVKFLEF